MDKSLIKGFILDKREEHSSNDLIYKVLTSIINFIDNEKKFLNKVNGHSLSLDMQLNTQSISNNASIIFTCKDFNELDNFINLYISSLELRNLIYPYSIYRSGNSIFIDGYNDKNGKQAFEEAPRIEKEVESLMNKFYKKKVQVLI